MPEDGRSLNPFQPSQPVNPSLFVGRKDSIEKILKANQHTTTRTRLFYIQGKRGIGKTSLAHYCRIFLEKEKSVLGFHIFLGSSPRSTIEFTCTIVDQIVQGKAATPSLSERIVDFFDKYIDEVDLGMIKLKMNLLAQDIPKTGSQFLAFLRSFGGKMFKGRKRWSFLLIFDELDNVATQPFFSTFLKELNDANGVADHPVPLLILLVGVPQSYQDIEKNNSRLAQMIVPLEIEPLADDEVSFFFQRAFRKVGVEVTPDAMSLLVEFLQGLPRWMHLIGDAILQECKADKRVSEYEAARGLLTAAAYTGKRYDYQSINALVQKEEYAFIMEKLCTMMGDSFFTRNRLVEDIPMENTVVVDRILQRLKRLGVIEKGAERGCWVFTDRLASLYIYTLYRMRRICKEP